MSPFCYSPWNHIHVLHDLMRDDRIKTIIEPFVTNTNNKEEILSLLEITMRNEKLKLIQNDTLISELLSFGIKVRQGKQSYEGLSEHDDTVIALALAVKAANMGVIPVTMVYI